MDFFVNLLIGKLFAFYLKLLLFPALSLLLLYFVHVIMLKIRKPEMPLGVHIKLVFLTSISITIVLYNIFWIYIILNNGVMIFNWSHFSLTRSNIYFMLAPALTGYFLLLYLFARTQKQIKNLL
jgi:hypothetical protein